MKALRPILSFLLLTLVLSSVPVVGRGQPRKDSSRHGALDASVFEAFAVPDYAVDDVLRQKIREEIAILTRLAKQTTDPNRRADILLRIAELHWLDGRSRYFAAMEVYNRQYDEFLQKKRAKRPVEPKFSGETSFRIFQEIIRTAPTFEALDEVLFRVGYYAKEIGDPAALSHFQRVVTEYPRSKYRLDAYMEIGDLYFVQRRFDEAISAFNVVLREPSKLYNFALYKISWCLYNQGKVRPAMTVMQRVVKSSKGVANELELREESLKDLVLFFSDLGLVQEAQDYFGSIGEPAYARKVLEKLAGIYFEQARYEKASDALKRLMALDPNGENRPRHHSRLIECYEKSQDLPRAMTEMEDFISAYDRDSVWHRQNTNEEIRGYAYERSEVYARFLPKKHHEISQQVAKSDPERSQQESRLALDYYRRYLDRFGDHKNAYETRYLYAELLFKHGMFAQAATEYETVVKADRNGKRRKDAFVGQMDSLTRLEEVHYKDLEAKGVKQKNKYDPIPLSTYAQKLIEADEGYAKAFPKDPRVPDILLQRAQLFYNYNQLDRAQSGFAGIIRLYPQTPASHTARDLTLDVYNIRKDWEAIETSALTFLQEKSYATPENRTKLLELIQGSLFQRAKAKEDRKEYVPAAEMFERLVNRYPDSKFADKALFNATVNYVNADASQKAMAAATRFLKAYPDSPLAPKMILALATYFDDKLDYLHAAEYYELLAEKDPKGPQAADALFNAGIYRENLKAFPKALVNYETHLKRYPQSKDAAEIQFSIGMIQERRRSWREAADAFRLFTQRYSQKREKAVEASFRLGQALEKLKDPTGARRAYQGAVALNRKYGEDPAVGRTVGGRYAAAAEFELAKPMLEEFRAIRLRMPQSALTRAIEQKALLLKKLRDRYLEIINFGDAEMGVRALYHVGLIYQEFSRALFNAPVPKNLSPEEVQLYQQELTNRAAPIEEKAVEAYEKAVKKAFELEVYDEWEQKAYDALTQFKPESYPPRRGQINLASHVSEPIAPFTAGSGSAPAAAKAEFVEPAAVPARTPAEFRRTVEQNLREIESNPRNYGAYLSLGNAFRKLGQLDKAARAFENASLVKPAETEPMVELAWIYVEQKQYGKAIPIYRDLLAKNPSNWAVKNSLAIALRRKKDHGEALALIREMLNADKNNIFAINNLGLIYYDTQSHELAELTLQKGKKINAATAETYNNLGLVYLAMGLTKNAIAEFKKAAERSRDLAAPRMNLGNLYLAHSNFALASAMFREALDADPLNLAAHQNLGVALLASGEVAPARQAFATLLEIDPNSPPALFNLGLLYMNQLRDPDTALRYFRKYAAVERGKIPPDHEVFLFIRQLQSMPKRPKTVPAPSKAPSQGGTP